MGGIPVPPRPTGPVTPRVDGTPILDYGSVQRRSAYGDPTNTTGNIGNQFQNFARGAAKVAGPAAALATLGPPGWVAAGLLAVGSGIWNAVSGEQEQNNARKAELDESIRVRNEWLKGKDYLSDVEKQQLALYDKQINKLRQDYENSKAYQASILARQQQAAQFSYGGALGATGMSYAAAQPGLMRGLAARGMLGTGAEAAARAGLAGQRAAGIERAAQNYSDVMSKAYQSDAEARSRMLGTLSTGETAIDAAKTKFNTDMAAAQFQLDQGNRGAAYQLADQAKKNLAQFQKERGADILQGVTTAASSDAFKTALGSAFGPASTGAAPTGGLGVTQDVMEMTERPRGTFVRPPFPTPILPTSSQLNVSATQPGVATIVENPMHPLIQPTRISTRFDNVAANVPELSQVAQNIPGVVPDTVDSFTPNIQQTAGLPRVSNSIIDTGFASPYKSLMDQTSQMLQLPKSKPRGGLSNMIVPNTLSYGG